MPRGAVREQCRADADEGATLARHDVLREVEARSRRLVRGLAASIAVRDFDLAARRAGTIRGLALVGALVHADRDGDRRRIRRLELQVRRRRDERRAEGAG